MGQGNRTISMAWLLDLFFSAFWKEHLKQAVISRMDIKDVDRMHLP
jgi:hypothetical protein